jgi:bifunctional aspartokinase / homoserine dehydrogenase 1
MRLNIPIVIRNIFNLSAPGTVICEQPINETIDDVTADNNLNKLVKAFATIDNLALVNVEG